MSYNNKKAICAQSQGDKKGRGDPCNEEGEERKDEVKLQWRKVV